MKLSTRTRYGLRLSLNLAMHYGEQSVFLHTIADDEEISEKYLSQIILPLKAAGLIVSERGARGGYRLGRDPASITVWDIAELLEGGLKPVPCARDEEECRRSSSCAARIVWQRLGEEIQVVLSSYTLKDLLRSAEKKNRGGMSYAI